MAYEIRKNDRYRNMERMEIIPLVPYGTLTILSVLPATGERLKAKRR